MRMHTRRNFLIALALGVVTGFSTPPPATATPVEYTLSGITDTNLVGTDTLTGEFTYDSTIPSTLSVNITETGPIDPGTYQYPNPSYQPEALNSSVSICSDPACTTGLFLYFAGPLDGSIENITNVVYAAHGSPFMSIFDVTGAAVPAVPEPASLTLLSGAIGLLFLRRRATPRGACSSTSG